MVAERHRLGGLKVGEARHHARHMLLGAGDQRALQPGERGIRLVDRIAHPELEIGRDLVVARAGRVEPARGGADQLGEPVLDMHVDVLERRIFGDAATLIFVLDLVEPLLDRVGILLRHDAVGGEHGDVDAAGGDVLAPQALVEPDRGIYRAHERRRPFGEPPAPHGVGVLILAACNRLSPRPHVRPRARRMR